MTRPDPAGRRPLARPWQWLILGAMSSVMISALLLVSFPAAWLIGAMIAGIFFTVFGGTLRITNTWSLIGQGVLGTLIANAMPLDTSVGLVSQWPVFLFSAICLFVTALALGWILTAAKILPGTTVVWGLSPGAATMMTFMAENAGADAQTVAFMQYIRLVLIAIIATAVTWVIGHEPAATATAQAVAAPLDWIAVCETLVLALAGPAVARLTGIKSMALVFPLAGGLLLSHLGWLDLRLPAPLLFGVYTLLGWRIGLRFTRPLVMHALSVMPAILLSSLLLLGACAGVAAWLVVFHGVDPLTAYLATSPGGVDMVAVLSASGGADMGFVMTMQMLRFLLVLAFVPPLAGVIGRRSR